MSNSKNGVTPGGNARPNAATRLIRISELASTSGKPGLIPASPATIWRWVKAGAFPQPVRLSDRVTAWDAAQVDAFIATKRATQGAATAGAAA